jgi:Thioredoxin like C-terminal domain
MKQPPINKVRAPAIYGDFWFNTDPLTIRAMQGQVILLCFWDCTSESSLHLMEFVQEWARRYDEMGLVVIGIHSPEFSFARDPKLVEKALQRAGIRFPVTTDNTLMMRGAYRVQEMPALFLLDRDGGIYLAHSGEGGYERIDRAIQGLLREAGFRGELPMLMEVSSIEDFVPSSFGHITPPVRTGYLHGSLGNVEGYSPELPAEYEDPHLYVEGKFYAQGSWLATTDAFEFEGDSQAGYLVLCYSGNSLNIVMSSKRSGAVVQILQNGKAISTSDCGEDITSEQDGNTVVILNEAKLFHVVKNKEFGEHTITIVPREKGIKVYSASFGVAPIALLNSINRDSYRNN